MLRHLTRIIRLVLGNLAAWARGACVVYPDEVFSPPAIVDTIQNHRCTVLHGVPAHFNGILAEVEKRQAAGEKYDFSSLRYAPDEAVPTVDSELTCAQNRHCGRLSSSDRAHA